MNAERYKSGWGAAPLLGLAAAILYGITLSRGAYPGESAGLMAGVLDLNPLMGASSHLLWNWVAELLARLPLGPEVSTRLNAFSALCGAVAVGVFAQLVADTIRAVIPVTDLNRRAADRASLLGGAAAAVGLMGSMPFWYAATRFHPATFDLLILFLLAWLFLHFMKSGSFRAGLVFVFLYALSAVEFATLIVFGPLVLVGVLMVLWHHGDLRPSRVLAFGGALLAGLLFYVPASLNMLGNLSFQLGVGGGFGQALFHVLKGQYQVIAKSLPQIGWLLVILVGILPWLAVLVVGRRGLNEERDWGLYILHAFLTALVLAVLFNVPFSPWRLLGPYRLLVTPYALLAFCLGYLAAYWSLFSRLFAMSADEDEPRKLWWREYGGLFPAGLILAAAGVALALNFREADGRRAGAVNAYARAVVEAAAGREWLVTDGVLDSNIQIAARERDVPLKLLNLYMGNHALYMRAIAREFQDQRLKSLAEVDGLAFLREWMASDPAFASKVAFLGAPDMWFAAGLQPVPERVLYTGVKSLDELDPQRLFEGNRALWGQPFVKALQKERTADSLLAPLAGAVTRHLSMIANNLGVVLEDAGWRQQAYESYAQARLMDTNNISALLNQLTMVDRGYAAPDAARIRDDFKGLAGSLKQKLHIWSLSRVYGYVRMPEAFANLGMNWVYSGQAGMAVAGFKRAIELAPDRRDQLSQGLAMAYLAQDQEGEGEAILRQLVERDPKNLRALLALARLMARQNRFEDAVRLLDQAQKAGASREGITLEHAALHMAAGVPDKARVLLQELVELKPGFAPAWALLAGVLIQQNDTKALQECERRLERVKGRDFLTTVVLGQIALGRGDGVAARTYFDQALGMRPNAAVLLDLLLRLDVQEGRRDLASGHIRGLLLADPGHPFANQVLASLQLERKEYALAENSLRKSLERRRDPAVVNDLAWVLQEGGNLAEAEPLVREALRANDTLANAWDTLGVILTKRGVYDEAEAALNRSLALYAENPAVRMHVAQLHERRGDVAKAAEVADDLLARPAGLSVAEQEELRRISRRNK
jgi:tetratricopeptide (TPR) repeat protein